MKTESQIRDAFDALPTPYYQRGPVTIWHGDCMEILALMDAAAIDACISDPPYGIGYVKGAGGGQGAYRGKVLDAKLSRHIERIKGDEVPFDPAHLVSRFPNCLLFGANHFCKRLPDHGRWLAWNKLEYIESFDSFSDVEFAWHSKGRASRVCNFMWKGGLACRKEGEDNGRRYHPTQKPVGVMTWCIEQAGVGVDALIIDPYLGSGSTAVACVRSGHRCIGIEFCKKYCDIAAERCDKEISQGKLAFPEEKITETQTVLQLETEEETP